jgi:hypothetical protein
MERPKSETSDFGWERARIWAPSFFDTVRIKHDPEKPALGLDQDKSDVSDLRPSRPVSNVPTLATSHQRIVA